MQLLEQEKHKLRRKLDLLSGEYENRLVELQTDCNILKNKLDQKDQSSRQFERVSCCCSWCCLDFIANTRETSDDDETQQCVCLCLAARTQQTNNINGLLLSPFSSSPADLFHNF